MGRPKAPLIERGAALDAALSIIDQSGTEGFSIRRLADELGVNGASLYHHFKNKDAILVEATERAIKRTPMVILDVPEKDWRSLLLSGSAQLLDLLLSHPTLMPIIIKRRSMGMANRTLDAVTARLLAAGVPEGAIYPLFEALERFVIGWANREIAGGADDGAPDGQPTPYLDSAAAVAAINDRQLFDIAATGIMNAVVEAAHNRGSAGPAKRRPAKGAKPKVAGTKAAGAKTARAKAAGSKSAGAKAPAAKPRRATKGMSGA